MNNQRVIGLIGGMSWQSSAEYYRVINQVSKQRLGGHHQVRSLLLSVDFGEVEELQHRGEWNALGEIMATAARQLEAGRRGLHRSVYQTPCTSFPRA